MGLKVRAAKSRPTALTDRQHRSREVRMPFPVAAPKESLLKPEPLPPSSNDVESLDVWGFQDSGFTLNRSGHVVMRGHRYELSGLELPRLLPWIRETLGIALDPKDVQPSSYPTYIASPLESA